MLVIAHRGYHAECPENTLDAFAAALEHGCLGIETDVRLSADGLPVLLHDRVLADGNAVEHLTRAQLEQRLQHAVPTLEEALDSFEDPLWNIEVKTRSAWPVAREILRRFHPHRQILVTSFCHDLVVDCARELFIDCGLLTAARPMALNTLAYGLERFPRLRTLVWDYEVIDDLQIRQANQIGLRNLVYGPRTLEEHQRCFSLGVHAVITDFPAEAHACLWTN